VIAAEFGSFEFNHQPFDLRGAATLPLRDLFVCRHHRDSSKSPLTNK
jgi:hypothetical protein